MNRRRDNITKCWGSDVSLPDAHKYLRNIYPDITLSEIIEVYREEDAEMESWFDDITEMA